MNMIDKATACISCIALAILTSASALAADNEKIDSYQQNALFQPSNGQLIRESQGLVYIYDGLTDKTVNKAMDNQPDRIKSMMFVNTKLTDNNGDLLRDTETGEILVEDDDC